jgi:signal peptidase I
VLSTKSFFREFGESILIALVIAGFIIIFIAQIFVVEGGSMEPTLHDGQRLLVDKLTYRFREPRRGEIVVFRYPADPKRNFIKRVMGLPGDEIEIKNWTVYVNDVPISEEYINGPTYNDFGPVVVPEDSYFVLGDNRNRSQDSRYSDVGFVPKSNILGKALFVIWPINEMDILKLPEVFSN